MTDIHVTHAYPHPPALLWRALTDPDVVPRWTATGLGGRPEGFAPVVGTRFRFVTKPNVFFRGVVECVVLEAREPSVLRHTWVGDDDGETTVVAWRIEPTADGSRLTYDHTGFRGVGGFFVSRVLRRARTQMFDVGLPPVLADLARSAS